MSISANEWISRLRLEKHPEGGYFRENYRSGEIIAQNSLPARFPGDRCFSTSIYYLLSKAEYSAFHRIKQDETWHFYDGTVLFIHMINIDGNYRKAVLGLDSSLGAIPQFTVPAGSWFAAELADKNDGFCLCGCTVAPGFDFADFEMPSADSLIRKYPQHKKLLLRLGLN